MYIAPERGAHKQHCIRVLYIILCKVTHLHGKKSVSAAKSRAFLIRKCRFCARKAVAAAAATTTRTAAAAAADRLKSFIPPSDRTGGFLSFFTGKNVVYYIKRRCFPWISAPLNDTIAAMCPRCRRLAANTPFCSPCCKSRRGLHLWKGFSQLLKAHFLHAGHLQSNTLVGQVVEIVRRRFVVHGAVRRHPSGQEEFTRSRRDEHGRFLPFRGKHG